MRHNHKGAAVARELKMAAANFTMVPDQPGDPAAGGLVPSAEVCMVFTEPVYRIDGGGGVVKSREPSQFRFHTSADGLRQFVKWMSEWADTMDQMAAAFGGGDGPKDVAGNPVG